MESQTKIVRLKYPKMYSVYKYKTRNAFVLHSTDPDEWGQQIEVDGGQGRIPR